ncbi:MAG: alpha/beta fold hydrolase [Microthrixaceae bacterium]|nr:alpha/beta fold hydrolase [Microthrixaceae bacterium]
MLAVETEGVGPRLVLVHGFAQTARCWGAAAHALAADHEVHRVDAPGHGRSDAVRADLADTAALLADLGPATYLGYSMGGRMCLEAALRHPGAVTALVLVSATAGIDDADERAARRVSDEALAARLETVGVDAFVDQWLSLPLFAGLPPTDASTSSVARTPRPAWHRRCASPGRDAGPVGDRLAALTMLPVLPSSQAPTTRSSRGSPAA